MSRRLDLLRLDYAFSVLVPCLMAIYINNLNLFHYLDIIFGFLLYAITGNTLNDAIDMRNPDEKDTLERVQGYQWKEIAAISIIAFMFGTTLFVRTIINHPINLLFLVLIIIMVVGYCIKKDVPIFNQILLGASHVFLPYIIITTEAGKSGLNNEEWFIMLTFFSFAFAGQVVHEIIDGDAISRYSLKTQQIIVIISSCVTIIFAIFTVVLLDDIYFIPLAIIPIGSIYTFRRPTVSSSGVKDVGIILGNIMLLYFLILILNNMYGI